MDHRPFRPPQPRRKAALQPKAPLRPRQRKWLRRTTCRSPSATASPYLASSRIRYKSTRHPTSTPTSPSSPCRTGHRTQLYASTPASHGSTPAPTSAPRSRHPLPRASASSNTTNLSVGRGTRPHPFSFFGAGTPTAAPHPPAPTHAIRPPDTPSQPGQTGPAHPLTGTSTSMRQLPRGRFTGRALVPSRMEIVKSPPPSPPATSPASPSRPPSCPSPTTVTATPTTARPSPPSTSPSPTAKLLDSPELGIEILAVLHRLYPTQFQLARVQRLLCSQPTLDALTRGDDPRDYRRLLATRAGTIQGSRHRPLQALSSADNVGTHLLHAPKEPPCTWPSSLSPSASSPASAP